MIIIFRFLLNVRILTTKIYITFLLFKTSYNRYQVLAFATDADERQETEQQKLSSGKRLAVKPVYFT